MSTLPAHSLDARTQFRIRDVSRVPRHEEIDPMVRGGGDMRGVCSGRGRQGDTLDECGCEVSDFGHDVQDREPGDQRRPPFCGVRITGENFVEHDLTRRGWTAGADHATKYASTAAEQPR